MSYVIAQIDFHRGQYYFVDQKYFQEFLLSPVHSYCAGHNLPDKSCVADTAMQIELA